MLRTTFCSYPLDSYKFSKREKADGDPDDGDDLDFAKLRSSFGASGACQSVFACMVVAVHRHPHVLLLKKGEQFNFPGGELRPGENEMSGIQRILNKLLGEGKKDGAAENGTGSDDAGHQWETSSILANWHRPNFDTPLYPYALPHIKRPKETRQLFMIRMPQKCTFTVSNHHDLVAVPLFDIHEAGVAEYGPEIGALPALLSRFSFIYPEA